MCTCIEDTYKGKSAEIAAQYITKDPIDKTLDNIIYHPQELKRDYTAFWIIKYFTTCNFILTWQTKYIFEFFRLRPSGNMAHQATILFICLIPSGQFLFSS